MKEDMHKEDIKAELRKRGFNLSKLGLANGLSSNTLRNALDKRYPKGEKIIAEALNTKPSNIWPLRYLKN